MQALRVLEQQITECTLCPRLVEYRLEVARTKRKAYRHWTYWGRPVPGFGDPMARVLILGLAPAAHGGNRTGRVFTGDRSGDFLYKALYDAGFASQPETISAQDGMVLRDAFITASVRCAPPDNKPLPIEIRTCRPYFERELGLLPNVQVVVALGKLAFDVYLSVLHSQGHISRRSAFVFGHNVQHFTASGLPHLVSSYHPSQQNTSTGKLTEAMFRDVFERVRDLLRLGPRSEILSQNPDRSSAP